MIKTTDLLSTINDRNASGQDRIEAIQLLREIRLHKKKQSRGPVLGDEELPGQTTLRETMEDPENQVDVRCQAAAAAAQTDNSSTLNWCIEIMKQHLEQ